MAEISRELYERTWSAIEFGGSIAVHARGCVIADVPLQGTIEETRDVAHLIAAAPKLRRAAQAALDHLEVDETSTFCSYCDRHAPLDDAGWPAAGIPHADDCVRGELRRALREASR